MCSLGFPAGRLLALAACFCFTPSVASQGIRVNAPLMRAPGLQAEDVLAFAPVPDEELVLFLADPEEGDRFEVFVAPVARSAARRRLSAAGGYASGPLRAAGGRAAFLQLTPPSSLLELHAVPLDGSAAPVRLHPPLAPGGRVDGYEITSDGARVVFRADLDGSGVLQLFSAPSDASAAAVALVPALVPGGGVGPFALTADGATVVYLADQETDERQELWSVPADGSANPVKLSPSPVLESDVSALFEITADGGRAVFAGDLALDGLDELWSAPIDGSAPPLRLDPTLVPGDGVEGFRLTADGARGVYLRRDAARGVTEPWAVPVSGGAAPWRIGDALDPGQRAEALSALPPGAARAVYRVQAAGGRDLYSAPLGGGPALRLNDPVPSWAELGEPTLAPGAERVVYTSSQRASGVVELWSVPVERDAGPVLLSGAMDPRGDVTSFLLDPSGAWAVYRADPLRDEVFDLWSVPLDGRAPPTRLNAPLRLHEDVSDEYAPFDCSSFAFSAGGTRVLYRSDQRADETWDLWSVPVDRRTGPIDVAGPLEDAAILDSVREFHWTPDGRRLVYVALERADFRLQQGGAFSAEVPAPGIVESIPVVSIGTGDTAVVSPDGNWAALIGTDPGCMESPCTSSLRWAPIDASLPAQVLVASSVALWGPVQVSPDDAFVVLRSQWFHPPGSSSSLEAVATDGSGGQTLSQGMPGLERWVYDYALDPLGLRVVFTERHDDRSHLYSTPLGNAEPAVLLHAPFPDPLQRVASFLVMPDGSDVLFLADPYLREDFQLHRVPLDGAQPPWQLGPDGEPFRDFEPGFRLAGQSALCVVDHELWSVPVDPWRGQLPLRLSDRAAAGRGVAPRTEAGSQFEPAPDGVTVVYLSELAAPGRRELFGVPVDGSAAPRRLHPPLAGDQTIELSAFHVDATSRWVVFAANLGDPGVVSLYRVSIEGGIPLELAGPFVPGGGLRTGPWGAGSSFALSPDGRHAVYVADQRSDEAYELFGAPVDGSRVARRLSGPLVEGGDVRSFAFAPTGAWIAYLADAAVDGVDELFLASPEPLRIRTAPVPRELGSLER